MFRFWKKEEKVEEIEAINWDGLKVFAVFKLKIPEFEAACLRASGDTSLDTLLKGFSARVEVPARFFNPFLSDEDTDVSKVLLRVHQELIKHLDFFSSISKEAAQLLMSVVKKDYDSLREAFYPHEFIVQFEEDVEISGENPFDILEKAEAHFAGRETPKLVLMRKVVKRIELIWQRSHA